MERKELISKCRYYKGEAVCPDKIQSDDKEHIWFDEKRWVKMSIENSDLLQELITIYKNKGYEKFSENDGTPISLKAFLLDKFYKLDNDIPEYSDDVRFVKWYNYRYLR